MRGMQPEDVYELTGVGDPRVSPDGRTVAAVVWRVDREANEYRGAIWLAAADGSCAPRRFTSGGRKDGAPRWSPDGTRLAFTSNRDGDAAQLYVIDVAGGEARRLTSLKESVEEPAWSPDGTRIAYCARVPEAADDEKDERRRAPRRITRLQFKLDDEGWTTGRRRHVSVVAADGSEEPVQLTLGDFEDGAPAWSPDGTRIAFASARRDDWDVSWVRDLYLVEAKGGEPALVTGEDGVCDQPSWSPDGTRIAYLFTPGRFDEPRHGQVAVLDLESGERRILTASLDRNCAPYPGARAPVWDGERLLFGVEDGGATHLYAVAASGGEPERLAGGALAVAEYDAAGGTIATVRITPTEPAELYVGERRLTEAGRAFADARELVAPERFTAVSRDGTEVEAWIVRPSSFDASRRYPVLLNVHGGPFTQYGYRLFDEFQVQAGAGYAVVYSNPRGSSGYSEAWARAIRGPAGGAGPGMGTVDYEDVMAVADEALRRFPFCDPDRMGILGGSYGGYMASWVVAHTGRFKAALSERAVNSWPSMYGSSDAGWSFAAYVGAHFYEDPEAWARISPATYASGVRTPLLILHSENDLRCAIEQAEQLFTTLRLLGREVEMVRFPSEGHELSRSGSPVHRVQRFEVILEWFARHLGG